MYYTTLLMLYYYIIIAAAIIVLSPQDNECNIIYSSLFIDGGGGFYMYMYIYIYIYTCILVQFIRHTTHVAFCDMYI